MLVCVCVCVSWLAVYAKAGAEVVGGPAWRVLEVGSRGPRAGGGAHWRHALLGPLIRALFFGPMHECVCIRSL